MNGRCRLLGIIHLLDIIHLQTAHPFLCLWTCRHYQRKSVYTKLTDSWYMQVCLKKQNLKPGVEYRQNSLKYRSIFYQAKTCQMEKDKSTSDNVEIEPEVKKQKLTETSNNGKDQMADKPKDSEKPKTKSLKPIDWVKSWEKRDIGFHRTDVHPMLQKHLNVLINGRKKVKIFYPLCGKAVDMKWLADMGHTVVGVDVSEQGLKEFFEEQNLEYTVEKLESVQGSLYKTKDNSIRLYCCDFYDFNKNIEGNFGAVWDRGSLVAINREDREKYAATMKSLMAPDCQYLVELFDYDPNKFAGPPHCVSEEELMSLFSDLCNIKKIDREDFYDRKERELFGLDYLYEDIYVMTLKENQMADEQKAKFNSLTPEDWVKRWEEREIGFHKTEVHPLLKKHLDVLINGREKVKIFYPLCGKAVDMKWLADMGHTVVGVDVSEQGLKEFFEEQNLEYTVEKLVSVQGSLYKSKDNSIRLYCCDFYDFNKNIEGDFGAIWDRGSLVAINREDREKYAATIKPLMAPDCQYLVDIFDYDSNKYGGPPQFVPEEQLISLFSDVCNLKKIDRVDSYEPKHRDNWGLDYFYEVIFVITLK